MFQALNVIDRKPLGMLLHIAGPVDRGWRVIEVWESREAFNEFWQTRLSGAAKKAGVELGEPEQFAIHNMLQYATIKDDARPVGFWFQFPGVSEDQYDRVMAGLSLPDNQMPEGGLFHLAGPVQGGWRVIDVWESREAFDAFFREQLEAQLASTGLRIGPPQEFEVHNLVQYTNVLPFPG
jgi:heme-degrading monooxygenase HmoA